MNRRGFIKALALVPVGAVVATKLPSDEVVDPYLHPPPEGLLAERPVPHHTKSVEFGDTDSDGWSDHHLDAYSYIIGAKT